MEYHAFINKAKNKLSIECGPMEASSHFECATSAALLLDVGEDLKIKVVGFLNPLEITTGEEKTEAEDCYR